MGKSGDHLGAVGGGVVEVAGDDLPMAPQAANYWEVPNRRIFTRVHWLPWNG
jgi:hypothetical protein